jgi:hypothetical protein
MRVRRKLSDELPRHVGPYKPSSSLSSGRRRTIIAVVGLVLLFWIFCSSGGKSSGDGPDGTKVDWNHFAYSLYATDSATVCHAVLIFDALAKFGSKADRVLFYPEYWDTVIENAKDRDSQLLVIARDQYKVKLKPIRLLSIEGQRTEGEPAMQHVHPIILAWLINHLCRETGENMG